MGVVVDIGASRVDVVSVVKEILGEACATNVNFVYEIPEELAAYYRGEVKFTKVAQLFRTTLMSLTCKICDFKQNVPLVSKTKVLANEGMHYDSKIRCHQCQNETIQSYAPQLKKIQGRCGNQANLTMQEYIYFKATYQADASYQVKKLTDDIEIGLRKGVFSVRGLDILDDRLAVIVQTHPLKAPELDTEQKLSYIVDSFITSVMEGFQRVGHYQLTMSDKYRNDIERLLANPKCCWGFVSYAIYTAQRNCVASHQLHGYKKDTIFKGRFKACLENFYTGKWNPSEKAMYQAEEQIPDHLWVILKDYEPTSPDNPYSKLTMAQLAEDPDAPTQEV